MTNFPHGSMPLAALAAVFGGPHWAMYRPVAHGLLSGMAMVSIDAHLAEVEARRGDDEGGENVDRSYPLTRDGIAILSMVGPMTKAGPSSMGSGVSTVRIRRQIREAAADSAVRAIVLRIDSPGGSVSGTSDLAADVLRARRQKPVWAYIEDMGASAAYWIASTCDRVWAGDTALVGSIGTYLVLEDWSRYYQLNGIEVLVFSTGEHKGAGMQGAEITPEQRADFQRVVQDLNGHFLSAVSRGRKLKGEALDKVATGTVWVGADAKALGLVDDIGDLEACTAALADSFAAPPSRTGRSARADETLSGEAQSSTGIDTPAPAPAAEAVPDEASRPSADADAALRRRLADATTQARLTLATTTENHP